MKEKAGLQFLAIYGVLIVFLVIVGSTIYMFNAQKKVVEKKQEIATNDPVVVTDESAQFISNNEDWSIEYPAGWAVDSNENFDFVTLSAEKLSTKDTEPNVIFISKLREGKIGDLIDESLNILTDAEVTTTHNNDLVGTQIEGIVAEGAIHKFAPGTYSIDTYFMMPDNSIVHIRTNNKNYLKTYQSVVNSFAALQSDKITNITEANIEVYDPRDGDTISSPIKLSGQARVFENTVNYILFDDEGDIIVEGFTTANSPDIGEFGDFTEDITYITTAPTGKLQVFQYSAKDGSMDDLVEIDVVFN